MNPKRREEFLPCPRFPGYHQWWVKASFTIIIISPYRVAHVCEKLNKDATLWLSQGCVASTSVQRVYPDLLQGVEKEFLYQVIEEEKRNELEGSPWEWVFLDRFLDQCGCSLVCCSHLLVWWTSDSLYIGQSIFKGENSVLGDFEKKKMLACIWTFTDFFQTWCDDRQYQIVYFNTSLKYFDLYLRYEKATTSEHIFLQIPHWFEWICCRSLLVIVAHDKFALQDWYSRWRPLLMWFYEVYFNVDLRSDVFELTLCKLNALIDMNDQIVPFDTSL